MSYRLRYTFNVDWVGAGIQPGGNVGSAGGVLGQGGGAQTFGGVSQAGGQNTATFLAADITTLTNAMAADVAAQLTTQITRIQNFSSGGG